MNDQGLSIQIKEFDEMIMFYTDHLETIRALIDYLAEATIFIKSLDESVNLKDFIQFDDELNLHGVLTFSILDLLVIGKHLLKSKETWETIYFFKKSALLIYETIKTYHENSTFLKTIVTEKYPALKPAYLEVNDDIKKYKKKYKYESTIKDLRNYTAGHINKEFKKYYNTIMSLKTEEMLASISDFIKILIKLQSFTREIAINAKNKVDQEYKQIAKSSEELTEKIEKLLSQIKQA